jgi:hypothetical protein
MPLTMTKTRFAAAVVAGVLCVPATAYATHVFDDVADGAFFADPVEWAFDNGITTGKSATQFAPTDGVTRGESVTFLKRYHDNVVAPSTTNLFASDQQGGAVSTSSLNPFDAGVSATVTIPEGHTGVIEARFTAESVCTSDGGNSSWCEVDFLVDGVDIRDTNQAFDSTNGGSATSNGWESHATGMVTGELEAGTYEVTLMMDNEQIIAGLFADGMTFTLDDMLLTAQVHLIS